LAVPSPPCSPPNDLTRRCSERLPVVRPTLPMIKPFHLRSRPALVRRR
jgi:hypothetical protein